MSRAEMPDAEAAAYYYAHRDDPEVWGEQVEAAVSKEPDRVISVRGVTRAYGDGGPGQEPAGA